MSKNKGMNEDGISDTFMKETLDWELMSNLWNDNTLQECTEIFKARLILLNKCYPNIPEHD